MNYGRGDGLLRSEATRQRIQGERRERDARRRQAWCGCAVVWGCLAIGLLASGIAVYSAAEHDRLHGWQVGVCTIKTGFSHNDTAIGKTLPRTCIYFNVETGDGEEACGIPARLAMFGGLTDPPACGHLNGVPVFEVTYWKNLERNGTPNIECLIPSMRNFIPPGKCLAAATSEGPGAAAWRAWTERFVYLIRDRREGLAAVRAATAVEWTVGIVLMVFGSFSLIVFLAIMCRSVIIWFFTACLTLGTSCAELRKGRWRAERHQN